MNDQLIICGMHRSGTSLVAEVLREAGLDIGRTSSGPELGQPRGHFEDPDFCQLHEAMLAVAGMSCFTADDEPLSRVVPQFEARARALVAARGDRPLWGWKDPRTCLFLDFWARLLPRARFLVLYRHPVDVVLSLWRRNIDLELRRDPELAFRAWTLYDRRLLVFRERHPEACFVAHAPAVVADLDGFVRRLAEKLDLGLRGGDFDEVFLADELAPSCREPRPDWQGLIPEALTLYDRLEAIADLPSAGEPVAAGRQRRLLQGSELLLHALISAGRGAERPPELEVREEYARLRVQEEALRQRLEDAAEGCVRLRLQEEALRQRLDDAAEATGVLRQIESSRSFAVVRAWWWLRRLGRRR